jgi:hypothetical protein
MVIGRSEDRDTPRDPMVLRHHQNVPDPIRVTHLGQRPSVPRTKAGHMTAIDQTISAANPCEARAVCRLAISLRDEIRATARLRARLSMHPPPEPLRLLIPLGDRGSPPGAHRYLPRIRFARLVAVAAQCAGPSCGLRGRSAPSRKKNSSCCHPLRSGGRPHMGPGFRRDDVKWFASSRGPHPISSLAPHRRSRPTGYETSGSLG